MLVILSLGPSIVFAQAESTTEFGSATSWLSVFLSLLVVVGVIFVMAFIMRRFTGMQSAGGQIKSVASLMVGTRERIVVIQVGEEQHLVGVTSTNINHIAKLDKPLPEADNPVTLKTSFANLLNQHNQLQGKNK